MDLKSRGLYRGTVGTLFTHFGLIIIEFNISNLDSNSENTSRSFEDLISLLINTNTGEWLEKHLLEHYYEFVQRFSKSSFDKKLIFVTENFNGCLFASLRLGEKQNPFV